MRTWLLVVSVVGLALVFAGGVVLGLRRPSPPAGPAPVAAMAPPSPPLAGEALPEVPPPPAVAAPAPQPRVASPSMPDLPTVEVQERPFHVAPDSAPPAPHVTLKDRDGRDITPRSMQLAQRPSPAPEPRQTSTTTITGTARVGDGTSLIVAGRTVALFGVRAASAGDRCGVGDGAAPRGCGEVAREALAARLKTNGHVSCRVPPGQRGGGRAAVCLDATGVDLGGFLVGEGLALADSAGSYDYVGAQNIARSYHRGLWRYR